MQNIIFKGVEILKKLRENRGEISILLILMVLVCLYFITAYFNAVKISYAMDEIQSALDIAGVATLERAINDQILKDEIYGLDRHNSIHRSGANAILNDYAAQLKHDYRNLVSFNRALIPSFEIMTQDIYFEFSSWGSGHIGATPQIVIETVMRLRLNISRGHDYQNLLFSSFYSSKRNANIDILTIGSTVDGLTELVIRSTVKSIYQ